MNPSGARLVNSRSNRDSAAHILEISFNESLPSLQTLVLGRLGSVYSGQKNLSDHRRVVEFLGKICPPGVVLEVGEGVHGVTDYGVSSDWAPVMELMRLARIGG